MTATQSDDRLFHQGDLITKARERAHMTQEQLGDELGVHRNTIGRWENNETEPKGSQLREIARVTRATWLLSDVSDLLTRKPAWVTADDIERAVAA